MPIIKELSVVQNIIDIVFVLSFQIGTYLFSMNELFMPYRQYFRHRKTEGWLILKIKRSNLYMFYLLQK